LFHIAVDSFVDLYQAVIKSPEIENLAEQRSIFDVHDSEGLNPRMGIH